MKNLNNLNEIFSQPTTNPSLTKPDANNEEAASSDPNVLEAY